MFKARPNLPPCVVVQGLLLLVRMNLPRHLDTLQHLDLQLVILCQDLAVVSNGPNAPLRCIIRDLQVPHKLLHLQVLLVLVPVLRVQLEPIPVVAQNGAQHVGVGANQVLKLSFVGDELEVRLAQRELLWLLEGEKTSSDPSLLVLANPV